MVRTDIGGTKLTPVTFFLESGSCMKHNLSNQTSGVFFEAAGDHLVYLSSVIQVTERRRVTTSHPSGREQRG